MAEISKISGVAIADVAKVDAILKADIANINGLTVPSAEAFLLDTYTGAAAGYSVRRLNSAYTGACMRVRRDSDNTEQDIGFDSNGDLDTSALATFVGSGNNGYVRYWYDQSTAGGTGSGNDAGQATAVSQPQIYNGAVITENGEPTLTFSGSQDFSFTSLVSVPSIYTAVARCTTTSKAHLTCIGSNFGISFNQNAINTYGSQLSGNASTSGDSYAQDQALFFIDAVSTLQAYKDGVAATQSYGASVSSSQRIGSRGTSHFLTGNIQEIVMWSTDHGDDRSAIETDINTYFSIYT